MHPDIAFGRYRETPATVWRPRRDSFEPQYHVNDAVFEDLRHVERADHDLRRFSVDALTARRILEDALIRNAFGTASIEGSPLSLADVESILSQPPTAESMGRPEEREILNYAAFMEKLDAWPVPQRADDLLALHEALFEGVLPDAGAFKQKPNFIGRRPQYEVTYVPALPERVLPELQRALDWLHAAEEQPLLRVQVFFHEFESIHPFRDGNGRAGRALMTLLLRHFGYEGVRFALVDHHVNEDREPYYANLVEVERNGFDYTPWIRYMSGVLRRAFEDAVAAFLFRDGLPPGLTDRQARVAEWVARLDRSRPGQRVKFNDVHAAFPTIPDRTLRRDLTALVEGDVLEREGDRKGAAYRLAAARRPTKGSSTEPL